MTGWLDAHAHYVTEHYAKECRAAGHAHPDGMPGLPDWSVAAALDVMGRAGIGTAVLSVSSPGVHLGNDSLAESRAARDLARHVNDAGAKIVASHPGRFGLSAVLPLPDVDGSLAELSRAYDELGADAIALETNYHGRYLTDPAFAPVLADMDARAAVVTLHPTSPPGAERTTFGRPAPMIEFLFDTTRCVVDLALSGTLARYPQIRWIVPHAGAVLPVLAHRVAAMSMVTGPPVDMPGILAGCTTTWPVRRYQWRSTPCSGSPGQGGCCTAAISRSPLPSGRPAECGAAGRARPQERPPGTSSRLGRRGAVPATAGGGGGAVKHLDRRAR